MTIPFYRWEKEMQSSSKAGQKPGSLNTRDDSGLRAEAGLHLSPAVGRSDLTGKVGVVTEGRMGELEQLEKRIQQTGLMKQLPTAAMGRGESQASKKVSWRHMRWMGDVSLDGVDDNGAVAVCRHNLRAGEMGQRLTGAGEQEQGAGERDRSKPPSGQPARGGGRFSIIGPAKTKEPEGR